MKVVYLNGRFIPLKEAKVSCLDRGFQYGDGVFETMRSYKGCVFYIEKHINRIFRSLKEIHIRIPLTQKKTIKIIYDLLKKNILDSGRKKRQDGYIKIIITRGISKGLLYQRESSTPTVFAYSIPFKEPSRAFYRKGITASISKIYVSKYIPTRRYKTLNYLDNILCRFDAVNRSYDDTFLVNSEGFMTEATSSNLFMVVKNRLYTPRINSGIFPGITRSIIIKLARALNLPVKECSIKPSSLKKADEIFITNSLSEITPVVNVDRKKIGRGILGDITRALRKAFKEHINEYCKRTK